MKVVETAARAILYAGATLAGGLLCFSALGIARDYVDQYRYQIISFAPCGSAQVCVLYLDNREGSLFWSPAPQAPARDVVPGVDGNPKVGI